MQRRDNGQPLRDAMQAAGLSIADLAERTRKVDDRHRGVGKSAIGHLVATGTSGRDHCRPRTARLIADALGVDTKQLFDTPPAP